MKYLIPIMIVAVFFLLQHCKTTNYTPDDFPKNQISFGSGGGFAGTYNHFYLLENGELFKNSTSDKTYTKIKKVKKNQVKQLFNNYETFNFKDFSLDDPGNMTFYVEYKINDKKHKMQWGGNNETPDPHVENLYKILMSLTRE